MKILILTMVFFTSYLFGAVDFGPEFNRIFDDLSREIAAIYRQNPLLFGGALLFTFVIVVWGLIKTVMKTFLWACVIALLLTIVAPGILTKVGLDKINADSIQKSLNNVADEASKIIHNTKK